MLPYKFRRQVPFLVVGAAVLAAGALLLPSDRPAESATAAVATAAPAPARPSYVVDVPEPADTTETAGMAPVTNAPLAGTTGSTPMPPRLALAPPVDAATAEQVDAAAAAASAEPLENLVHVGASAVNVRAGPTTSARKLFVLQPGEAVSAAEIDSGWVRIERPDGEGGWVYSRYLEGAGDAAPTVDDDSNEPVRAAETMPVDGEVRRVSPRSIRLTGSVTLRDGPSSSAERLFVLQPGERVEIAETRRGWARVVLPSGVSGWAPVR